MTIRRLGNGKMRRGMRKYIDDEWVQRTEEGVLEHEMQTKTRWKKAGKVRHQEE